MIRLFYKWTLILTNCGMDTLQARPKYRIRVFQPCFHLYRQLPRASCDSLADACDDDWSGSCQATRWMLSRSNLKVKNRNQFKEWVSHVWHVLYALAAVLSEKHKKATSSARVNELQAPCLKSKGKSSSWRMRLHPWMRLICRVPSRPVPTPPKT